MRHVFLLGIAAGLIGALSCSPPEPPEGGGQASELVQPRRWWESLPRPVYASLERVDSDRSWFEVYRLEDRTWALYEPSQFEEAISYLVAGIERAILIDTGTGIGDLRSLVSELTDLQVSVVNTHTHWDHIGGNAQFLDIACYDHPECIAKLRQGVARERLRAAVTGDSLWKPLPPEFDPETWAIPGIEPKHLLEDGDIIDLGERTLEVIHTPGHSPGSVCLLDRKYRLLFTGDTFFPGPLYAHAEDVDIGLYMASVTKLKTRLDEYDFLCSGHNDPWVKSHVILKVEEAFVSIMAGEGRYREEKGLRRYAFGGFDILIRTDQIPPDRR